MLSSSFFVLIGRLYTFFVPPSLLKLGAGGILGGHHQAASPCLYDCCGSGLLWAPGFWSSASYPLLTNLPSKLDRSSVFCIFILWLYTTSLSSLGFCLFFLHLLFSRGCSESVMLEETVFSAAPLKSHTTPLFAWHLHSKPSPVSTCTLVLTPRPAERKTTGGPS